MSSLTDEWQLKISEINIKYKIDIEGFVEKITTFNIGREIYSKNFKIGRSTFCILIYPGGNSYENRDYVSIFLQNKSDWRVKAKATFSIPRSGLSYTMPEDMFIMFMPCSDTSKSNWGYGRFAHHSRCTTDDLLCSDGGYGSAKITIQVEVELLEEEVLPERDLSQEHTIDRIEKLETTVHNLRSTIQNMETKNERQTNELKNMNEKQTNELKKIIQDLTLTLCNNLRPSQQRSSLDVECPVCMENIRPPMRLKQCGQVYSFNLL